jgi:arylsulfatase A-like enzyme
MQVLFEGRSLVPQLRGEGMAAAAFIESGTSFFPELVRGRRKNDITGRFRAVVDGRWKLIWTPYAPDAEAWQLYDMDVDPDETRNLYRPDHPAVPGLKKQLEVWLQASALVPPPQPNLSERDREALKALGYIE